MFSLNFKTYAAWRRGRKLTGYALRIIKAHKLSPKKSLSQLLSPKYLFSSKPWNKFTSIQKAERIKAFSVLKRIRKGYSLDSASKEFDLSPEKILKHLGKTIYKRKNQWFAKKNDNFQRHVNIFENGKPVSIIVRNNRDAAIIARYRIAISKFKVSRDPSHLEEFKQITIIDAYGDKHKLETDPQTLLDLGQIIQDYELFPVYADDDYA